MNFPAMGKRDGRATLRSAGAHSSTRKHSHHSEELTYKGGYFFMSAGRATESLINSRHFPKLFSEVTQEWPANKVLLEGNEEFLEL